MKYELGKRYKLPHGIGVLIGHEEFYDDGWKCRLVKTLPEKHLTSTRYAFELDDSNHWAFEGEFYYAWASDIKEIENEAT